MEKEKTGIIIALLSMALLILLVFASTAFAQIIVNTNADDIKIRAFYHGGRVDISGKTDPGADVIVKITSSEEKTKLREKGKVGFFWLNKDPLIFERVPNLYLLYSTKDIPSILNREEMDKYVIGYPALKKHIEIVPVKNESEKTSGLTSL
ncbi:MAG: TIGR02186 family protein [Firmicutes bacterium]|nr:TIGR02186 family protein [Bacillota bacterium]